jgi:hypothetical protein
LFVEPEAFLGNDSLAAESCRFSNFYSSSKLYYLLSILFDKRLLFLEKKPLAPITALREVSGFCEGLSLSPSVPTSRL